MAGHGTVGGDPRYEPDREARLGGDASRRQRRNIPRRAGRVGVAHAAKGLPDPSWQTAFGLGALSSVFDNIPLTALALRQGGYDWAPLSFAVGFGGSMVWFGSSAGVALTNMYPEGRSVAQWLKQGWFVPLAYVIGFFVMLLVHGWTPDAEISLAAHR